MASIRYRLQSTVTGDLALTTDPQTILLDRARLFLDVAQGERPLLPGFGLEINLFEPETPQAIQDAMLQRAIDLGCGSGLKVSSGNIAAN